MKKEDLIEEYLNKPYEVGESVYVRGLGSQDENAFNSTAKIIRVEDTGVIIKKYGRDELVPFSDLKKTTYDIGFNPFPEVNFKGEPRAINYNLESIIFSLERSMTYKTEKGFTINRVSFDPYIEIDGEKHYYQRPLVWTLEDKQLLLDSIYNRINCGAIIVRNRSFKWNETRECEADTSFKDIVDGKQRLSAIMEFLKDGYPDSNGKYYSDFSERAQNDLLSHQLFAYSEFGEEATDQDVINQFLKVNFSGKPQSKEHIEFVKTINDKFK